MPPLPLITAQTEEKLLAFLTEHGHTKFRTQQVLDWVWRKRVTTFDAMSNLPPALKNLLAENFRSTRRKSWKSTALRTPHGNSSPEWKTAAW